MTGIVPSPKETAGAEMASSVGASASESDAVAAALDSAAVALAEGEGEGEGEAGDEGTAALVPGTEEAEQAGDMASNPNSSAAKVLNVKDALSYLDRVKVTFHDQPEVYDRFLTIMKDFKSQGIDTPGVIDRVSTLFRGHPALIQGFNTFLPPGYRIECSVSTPQDQDSVTTITVTTPMGMTTRTQVANPPDGLLRKPTSVPTTSTPSTAVPPPAAPSTGANTSANPPVPPVNGVNPTNGGEAGAGADASTSTGPPPPSAAASSTSDNLHLAALPPAPSVASMAASGPIATPGAVSLLSSHLTPQTAGGPAGTGAGAGGGAQGDAAGGMRPPMEFNHAINYVNKIKNRFVRDPDTYKAFLEILQTYQKEGRAIQDVYAQVTTLFHAAPDLLDEFKQFLPDTSGDQANASSSAMLGQMSASGSLAQRQQKRPAPGSSKQREDPISAKKSKINKKVDERGGKRKVDVKDSRKVASTSDGAYSEGPLEPAMGYPPHLNPYAPGYPSAPYAAQAGHPAYAYEAPPLPPPPQPILPLKPQANQNDLAFFSRVKAYTSDVATYHEFLKLLNLYTQEIIDLTTLVSRGSLFIGQDAGLWREFRDIVGWTEGRASGDPVGRVEIVDGVRVMENVPTVEGPRRGKGDASNGWRTYGPSYRQLPSSEISLTCSGRDALCWDVLNDEWVSQPSWASDEGFVAHRKNPFEEELHRSEEERHEYDYHIEANLRTIALLEPIATRIAIMEVDERTNFRLKAGLGNQSKSIYQRVIKKVYGKEQGGEVVQALHDNPCVAVPIVLARLKQKDDEWKRALREWNRVWREIDSKNFWRSLDHQAIAIKANDKRALTIKALVTEVETIKREQRQAHRLSQDPAPTYQLEYDFSDQDAVSDVLKLVFSYLDRTPSVSMAEKDKVDNFLRLFLPLAFAIAPSEFALDVLATDGRLGDDDLESLEGTSDAGLSGMEDAAETASSIGSKRGGKRGAGGDLRKKALKNAVGPPARRGESGRRSKVSSPVPSSRGTSPAASANGLDGDIMMGDETDTELGAAIVPALPALPTDAEFLVSAPESPLPVDDAPSPLTDAENVGYSVGTPEPVALPDLIVPIEDRPHKHDVRKQWNMFANSNLYCLLRLFQIAYHRLTLLKRSAVILAAPPTPQSITPKHVPTLSLSLTIAPAVPSSVSTPPNQYYERALALSEKMFDGDIDQPAFEEAVRQMFGTQGYMLFTIEKVMQAIVKHAQSAVADSKSQELLDLLQQDRAHPDRSTAHQQTFYRTQAESVLGQDENLYRIGWIPEQQNMQIQLLGKDTIPADELPVAEREWATYLETFVLSDPTDVSTSGDARKIPNPFLPRNIRKAAPTGVNEFPDHLVVQSGLQCKVCLRTYRLFFVTETEDYIFRTTPLPKDIGASARKERFAKWWEEKTKLSATKSQKSEEGAQENVAMET